MRAPEFWSRDDWTARLATAALSPFGLIYGAVTDWKRRRTLPYRARAKVICIGNLTVGGSGKTPIVQAVARLLQARGLSAVILSRGYGGHVSRATIVNPKVHGAADVGDEPLLLAKTAPVIVSPNRRKGALLADAEGAEVILMDDGYQNFTLAKDFSIVVVDAEKGFGNGRILPAGPLRESVAGGLARADAVVLVGTGAPALPGFAGPVLRARLAPRFATTLKGRKVIAFAGIGQPEKFFDTLRALDADIVETHAFADHHAFSAGEIARLKARAKTENAMLLTTEKDFVRLMPADRETIEALPVEAEFEPADALPRLVETMLSAASRRQ